MSSSIETLVNREYAYGFVTDVETDTLPPGLSEAELATARCPQVRISSAGCPPVAASSSYRVG